MAEKPHGLFLLSAVHLASSWAYTDIYLKKLFEQSRSDLVMVVSIILRYFWSDKEEKTVSFLPFSSLKLEG